MDDLSPEEREIIDGDPDDEEHESVKAERKTIIKKLEGKVGDLRRGLSHTWVTPDFNWELGLEQRTFVFKGQLTFFRALALVGRERSLEGRQAEALDLLATGLAIAEDLATNGALVAEMVKEASQDRLRDEIGRILADHSVPAPALRELLRLLEAIDGRRDGIANVMSRELLCMKVSTMAAMDSITGMNWGLNPMPRYWFSNRVLMADAQQSFDRVARDVEL
ncbi:MAG TPA: hypothetical protein VJU16_00525, partial [Planctomycetota bacterium]|nr:hypothetical protein [Planctomycetota bacterium]